MANQISLKGNNTDGLWVQAVMYFPTDKFLRESWYTTEFASGLVSNLDSQATVHLTAETLTHLIDAPSHAALKEKTRVAVKRGTVVGDVLASIYLMDRFGLPEPGMNKAIHVAQRFARHAKYGDESTMRLSDRTIKKYWREYESVAHLWSAWRLNMSYRYVEDQTSLFFENLPMLLQVAAGQLEFGRTFVPARVKPRKAILDTPDIWDVPPEILPRPLDGAEVPEELIKYLEDYDAMEYRYKPATD